MREILFKAKRIDNGEWVEGYLFETREHAYIAYANQFDDDLFLSPQNIFIEVDANTICRYTGRTDKNGNKIWENDIVVYDNSPYNVYCVPHTGQIVHRNGCLCYKFLLYGSVTYKSFLSDDFFGIKCKVLGNIFDNPEFLEGGGEDD